MKGDHGVQAVQYRKGKKVSKSATRYFYVTAVAGVGPGQERVTGRRSWVRDALLLMIVIAVAAPAIVLVTKALTGDGDLKMVGSPAAAASPAGRGEPHRPATVLLELLGGQGRARARRPRRDDGRGTACRS